jgi:chromate transporter
VEILIGPGRATGFVCLGGYFLFLIFSPLLADLWHSHTLMVFAAFYRAGAPVFGGGHVVLPLPRDTVVKSGWISDSRFLAGYGAA